MQAAFKAVALIGKITNPEIRGQTVALAQFLVQRDIRIFIEEKTAAAFDIHGYATLPIDTIGAQADLAIVLGGDGTMLTAARALLEYEIPLVGINRGSFGFLTDICAEDMLDALERILAGEYTLKHRVMLGGTLMRDGEIVSRGRAFNDVVVSKGMLARLIELEVTINGEFVHRMRTDGLIVSTPTGTTGYALSAGGPILHPGLDAIALVPICPHTLSNRPFAISSDSTVEITVIHADDARAHFDGQLHAELQKGDKVVVRRLDKAITLLHPHGHSYYTMLRDKLNWG
jgi:NAD+ kinase